MTIRLIRDNENKRKIIKNCLIFIFKTSEMQHNPRPHNAESCITLNPCKIFSESNEAFLRFPNNINNESNKTLKKSKNPLLFCRIIIFTYMSF